MQKQFHFSDSLVARFKPDWLAIHEFEDVLELK